jgi:glutathione synthase/RimK-type ligase-like ATP-grasp enzyme
LQEAGYRVSFLDTTELGQGARVCHSIAARTRATFTASDGSEVELGKIKTVWYRRAYPASIPNDVRDPNDREFAQKEWFHAVGGLLLSLRARFVNPLLAERAALKPRQLQLARDVGLRVPKTLITNDAAAVRQFVRSLGGRVVHKALTSPPNRLLETRRWSETDSAALEDLVIAPSIFQAEIVGAIDIRVTVVGDRVFAARIASNKSRSHLDSRLDLDVPCEADELPRDVQCRILELMRRLGLLFGTIDMKITDDGDYFFLEVNPQGQFLYIEILTSMPITSAVANLLAQRSKKS